MNKRNNIKINDAVVSKAVKKVLRESFMATGGVGGNPVEKWIYWCYNFDMPIEKWMGIFKGAPAEHFIKEFDRANGDMNRFYLNLDRTNRRILLNYVENNFRG